MNMFLKNLVNFSSRLNYLIFLSNPFLRKVSNNKEIILVSKDLHSRVIKIAKSVKYMEGGCILITQEQSARDNVLFDKVIICNSKLESAYICKKYFAGSTFHVFCFWDYFLAFYLIFFKVGKIIVDPYDILNLYIRELVKNKYRITCIFEKYVFQKCSAIVCRDIRSNLLKKNGFKLPRRILYMDYIDPDIERSSFQKQIYGDLVYIGNIEVNRTNNVAYQYPLSKILNEKNINFYLYPSSQSQKEQLKNNCQSGEVMKIMNTLPYHLLHTELEKYSFGLLISTKSVGFYNQHDTYKDIMKKYFFATKIFDYYQAGIIPICQKGDFISFILRRMSIGFTVENIVEIPNLINDWRGKFITVKINKALTLEKNAYRLTNFYKTL